MGLLFDTSFLRCLGQDIKISNPHIDAVNTHHKLIQVDSEWCVTLSILGGYLWVSISWNVSFPSDLKLLSFKSRGAHSSFHTFSFCTLQGIENDLPKTRLLIHVCHKYNWKENILNFIHKPHTHSSHSRLVELDTISKKVYVIIKLPRGYQNHWEAKMQN